MEVTELEAIVRAKDADAPDHARKMGAEAVEALIPLLADADFDVRLVAINSLAEVGHPSALEGIVSALADDYRPVRTKAINTLWGRNSAVILPALYEALETSSFEDVRRAVPLIIGLVGDASSLPVLENAAEPETDTEVRKNLRLAMARLGSRGEQQSVAARLQGEPPQVLEAVRDIEYVADAALAKSLGPLLRDRRPAYRVGLSNHRSDARICDAAINAAAAIYPSPFSFPTGSELVYSEEQLTEAAAFFEAL